MRFSQRIVAAFLVLVFLATALVMPVPAHANEKGKRNTTIGLGAASAVMLITQRNKLPGVLTGAGAVYSYTQYQKEHDHNQRLKRRSR